MENKKHRVIEELLAICEKKQDFTFHNDLVKKVSSRIGFGNPFDVTKLDNKEKLPDILLQKNMAIIHLGEGYHKFVKGIDKLYHDFEPITKVQRWAYRKSLLNQYDTSESNILSVANNQRILHFFCLAETRNLMI